MNTRRLFRSRTDRAITGIAGGMAEYLEVDPTVVRILWVLAAIFTGGLAILLYIVLAFVIPVNPYQGGPIPAGAAYAAGPASGWGAPAAAAGQPGTAYATGTGYAGSAATGGVPAWGAGWNAEYERSRAARAERPGRAGVIIGTVLIVFGAIALADIVLPGWISGALVVPGLFVALGVGLVVASLRGRGDEPAPAAAAATAFDVPPAPGAPFQAAEPVAPAAASVVPAAEPAATTDATATDYDDESTTSLPPLPGSDRA
ncbi:MAG TPA: PspC domain-containing protein [Candidatus Limnocylindrales bacterium]|nr:PspC domain-containing protein [Candidatus Limnocylindrales bacterium]